MPKYFKYTLFILIAFLVVIYARMFSYRNFQRIGLSIPAQNITQNDRGGSARFASLLRQANRSEKLLLEIRLSSQTDKQSLALYINDRFFKEIALKQGKSVIREILGDVDFTNPSWIGFHFSPPGGRIERIEIKNVHGYASGLLSVVIAEKKNYPRLLRKIRLTPDLPALLWYALFLFQLGCVFSRAGQSQPQKPGTVAGRMLTALFVLILVLLTFPILTLLLTSHYAPLYSRSTFLLLANAALTSLAYGRGIHTLKPFGDGVRRMVAATKKWLKTNGFDRKYFVSILLVPLVFFSLYLVLNLKYFCSPLEERGDDAANALQIERAKRFQELLGPYSRFEFNHPGPVSFYYFTLTEPLLPFIPTPMGRHQMAQLILNLVLILVVLHMVYVMFSRRGYPLLLFLCLMTFLAWPPFGTDVFARIWPPNLLLVPMLAFILAVTDLARGETRFLLPATISAILITQNNISGCLVVGPFLLVAGGLFFHNRRRERRPLSSREIRNLLGSALLVIIAFLPVIYEQLTATPGNLTKIFRFFARQPAFSHSWIEASDFILEYYRLPFSPLAPGILVMVLWGISAARITKKNRRHNYLVLFLLLGFILAVFGAMKTTGELLPYTQLYHTALVLLLCFSALGSFMDFIDLRRVNWRAVVTVSLLAAVFFGFRYYRMPPQLVKLPKLGLLVQAIKPDRQHTYEIYLEKGGPHHDQWPIAAGLALKLLRFGIKVCVPADWSTLYGKKLACRDSTQDVSRVALYNTAKYDTRVRKFRYTFRDTTIEYGPMLPLDPPIHLDARSPGEYFRDWLSDYKGLREMSAPRAGILVPLGMIATDKEFQLTVEARSSNGKKFSVSINGQELAVIDVRTESVCESLHFAGWLLNANSINRITITELVEPPAAVPADFQSHLALKSIELISRD